MSYFEIILLAIGLCFDTLAVTFVQGAQKDKLSLAERVRIELTFGLVQGLFLLAGWLLGFSFLKYIEKFDHWVAFFLLFFIGGKMIAEALRPGEDNTHFNLASFGSCLLAAVATSIDALAVGVSMAMTVGFGWGKITVAALTVVLVTAGTAFLGLKGGTRVSAFMGKRSSVMGGLILIAIGIKILLEHILV